MFLVDNLAHFDLEKFLTLSEPLYSSNEDYIQKLNENVKKLGNLQDMLYASNLFSVLLIFQGMDTAGKDSIIKHVLSGINPQGCKVHSFKQPSLNELEHDFLWRSNPFLPERGNISIFNRSYYEDVLIVRVHTKASKSENMEIHFENGSDIWAQRFESINNFEKHLTKNGTRIIKFFLHLSKEEQRKRFLERIDQSEKNWKFSEGDITERGFWNEYQKAHEQCFIHTSTKHAPWYIVPADEKKNTRLIVSDIVVRELEKLKLKYPETTEDKKEQLKLCKNMLMSEIYSHSR